MLSFRRLLAAVVSAIAIVTTPATAQSRDEQFYYPGSFNWQFLRTYPEAARLFNAFDYGHAVLYERLYQYQGRPGEALEREYQYLTTDLLVRPPRFAIVEEAVMPRYAKTAWRAKQMFDWAHILHRQIYDVYADERLAPVQRDTLIERLTDYYLARKEYAFAVEPKSMALMDEQYFSQVFRKRYEKFNGLIWSYHWLQVGLYEPFIEGRTKAEKKAGVQATLARFWSMLEDAPSRFPKHMPMTPAIAPKFTAAHPRAAIVFDNLHMMHDIISDILTADTIPENRKSAMINEQLDKLQDTTRDVISLGEWRNMGEMMGGIATMGGPATGLLKEVHAPVTPAGGMQGMQHGGMNPGAMAKDTTRPADTTGLSPAMEELHRRMMSDPVIRRRIMADTAMRRLSREAHGAMPSLNDAMTPAAKKPAAKKSAGTQAPRAARPRPRATVVPARPIPRDSMKGMEGMKHP